MNDDIVTQLRIQADVVNSEDYHTISGGLHLDAANEIECLRADLKRWQALCDTYYHKLALEPDNTLFFIFGYRYLAAGGK